MYIYKLRPVIYDVPVVNSKGNYTRSNRPQYLTPQNKFN